MTQMQASPAPEGQLGASDSDSSQRRGFLPFHRPSIEEEDVRALVRALESGWLTDGAVCREFERKFADHVGAPRAISVSSGTAAMHLSLVALGVGPGDEVITTPFTFCATAHVIEHVGASPVFVDIDRTTLQIDPDAVKGALRPQTKAVLPVHYAGHPCDIETILRTVSGNGIPVVEDAAHALGAMIRGRPIGSFGTTTCFSFYATKNITTGEGGMVTTNDAALADRIERLRLHGLSRDAWRRYRQGGKWHYEVLEPGFKANFMDPLAALGLSQLAREPDMRKRRQTIAERYNEAFAPLSEFLEVPVVAEGVETAWHLYPLRLRLESLKIDRDDFIEEMEARGIGTSVHFIPLHLQPHFRQRYGYSNGDFPQSEDAFRRIVSLPIFPAMTDADIERVTNTVVSLTRENAS